MKDTEQQVVDSNENRSLLNKATSAVKGVFNILPKGEQIFGLVRNGLNVANNINSAGLNASSSALFAGLGTIATQAVSVYGQNLNLNTVLTHITGLGNFGTTAGTNLGEITGYLRQGSHNILNVFTDATNLSSKILQLFYNSVPTDGMTIPMFTKYVLYFVSIYYGTNIIAGIARNSCRIMDGITDKILSILNGQNRGQTTMHSRRNRTHYIDPKTNKIRKNYGGTAIPKYRPNRIFDRKNRLKNKNEERIISVMATFLMQWLNTELNQEPQPTFVEILLQIPDQSVRWMMRMDSNVNEKQQNDMKQYILECTPCDIIKWFYYSLLHSNNASEKVENWITQLPYCDFINPLPWMEQSIEMLQEQEPSLLEKYQLPENNIPWNRLQAYLN